MSKQYAYAKVKVNQKIEDLDRVLSRFNSTSHFNYNSNKISDQPSRLMHNYQIQRQAPLAEVKEEILNRQHSIHKIEKDIGQIMEKHQKKNKSISKPMFQFYSDSNNSHTPQKQNSQMKTASHNHSASFSVAKSSNKQFQSQKYDSQIQQINKRIRNAEEQKRKLNIAFKPFNFTSKKTSSKASHNQSHQSSIFQETYNETLTKNKVQQINNIIEEEAFDLCNETFRNTYPLKKASNGLIKALCKQIELDQKFRNAKIWFECNTDSSKWQYLFQTLKKFNIQCDKQQMKAIFSCGIDEHNPFFSLRQYSNSSSIKNLVQLYKQVQDHWKNKLYHHFTIKELQNTSFTNENLDLEGKGQITVEDLVRFLNMQTNNFYRNRDLILIFKRITSNQVCTYPQITNILIG